MNTLQINSCLSSLRTFKGTFACDNLPKLNQKRPFSFVANTDKKSGPGKHWVAFYIGEQQIEYFDSFGRDLLPCFRKYIGSRNYIYNDKRLQSFLSTVCGHYCIFFIYHRTNGRPMKGIVARIRSSGTDLWRDQFVRQWVVKKYANCKAIKGANSVQTCQSFKCVYHGACG